MVRSFRGSAAACSERFSRRMVQRRSGAPQYLKRGVAGGADCAAGWMGLAELQYQERKYQDSYETGVAGCAHHCCTPTHTCCRVFVPSAPVILFIHLCFVSLKNFAGLPTPNRGLALTQCAHLGLHELQKEVFF